MFHSKNVINSIALRLLGVNEEFNIEIKKLGTATEEIGVSPYELCYGFLC